MNVEEKFDLWGVVELFGHTKIAGKCTEQNIGGTNMLRVDVPETKQNPAFTRFLGGGAIYAINPVTEEVARFTAEKINVQPIQSWDISQFMDKHKNLLAEKMGNMVAVTEDMFTDDDDDDPEM